MPAELWRASLLADRGRSGAWRAPTMDRRAGVDEVSCQVCAQGALGGATLKVQLQVSNQPDVAEAGWLSLAELSFSAAGVQWAGEDQTLLIGTFALLRLKVSHSGGEPAPGASVTAWICGDAR
jgi:hypothetical protein